MKRLVVLSVLIVLVMASAFAAVNNQKVYSVTDEVYSNIETLYVASGYGLPSSSGPWTGSELLLRMKKLDRASLAPAYQKLYDSVMAALNPKATFELDTVSLDFGLELNPELYYRVNGITNATNFSKVIAADATDLGLLIYQNSEKTSEEIIAAVNASNLNKLTKAFVNSSFCDIPALSDASAFGNALNGLCQKYLGTNDGISVLDNQYNGSSEWFHGEDSRNPLVKTTFETWAAKNFYGYFELSLTTSPWKYLYQKNLHTNLEGYGKYKVTEADSVPALGLISWQFPQKALATAGGEHWSLTAGRDKLSLGAGETGNLMMSKSFDNHTFAQFKTFHNNFNYTLLGTYYPYYKEVYSGTYHNGQDEDNEKQNGFKGLIVHRVEYSMFKNKINLAVNEAVMIRKLKEEPFDIAMINPFGLMHNEYTRTNSNSIMVFEADVTPIKHINIYGQFALDDFSLPGQSDNVVPDANGFLVGAKANIPAGPGVLVLNVEGVKTSPYLYLRGVYESNSYGTIRSDSYGLGFDAVTRFFSNGAAITYNNDFITYTYGNDKIVLHGGAEYKIPEMLDVSLGYYGITSGVMNIYSPWGEKDNGSNVDNKVSTPTTTDPYSGKTGAVEYEHVITLGVNYKTPLKGLSVNGVADYIIIQNYNNVAGAKFNDIQATVGLKYAL